MKKLLLLLFTLPVFTLHAAVHQPTGFTANEGQVSSADVQVYFTLRGGALTYYFSGRGYSVVQSNGAVRARTDFFFAKHNEVVPQGEEAMTSTQHYFLAGRSVSVPVLSYHWARRCVPESARLAMPRLSR